LWEVKQWEGESAWELMKRFKGKLSYLIDLNHQRDWFIKALFPLTCTPLIQQKIDTLKDSLEKETQIEAMVRYPREYQGQQHYMIHLFWFSNIELHV